MPTRNEQVREASQDILRRATIIGLMRRALDPAPIADDPREPKELQRRREPLCKRQRRPRPLFVFPQNVKLRRLLMSCRVKKAALNRA
jgi:hypothetical protein